MLDTRETVAVNKSKSFVREKCEVQFLETVNHSRRSEWSRMFQHPYSLSDDIIPLSCNPCKFRITAPRSYFITILPFQF